MRGRSLPLTVTILVSIGLATLGCNAPARSPVEAHAAAGGPTSEVPLPDAGGRISAPSKTDTAADRPDTHEAVRAALLEHRRREIARLHEYAASGVFPINRTDPSGPIHMFRDADGHLCAVANLVYRDGLTDAVKRAAAEHNDVVVANETEGALHDWVLTSGLTREEVKRIQGAGFEDVMIGADGKITMGAGGRGIAVRIALQRIETQKRLAEVEAELVANTDLSIALATERLDESVTPEALASLPETIHAQSSLAMGSEPVVLSLARG